MNSTIIGVLEKKVLLWLAARTPAWIMPDTLTLIGLLASILIFISYALTYYDRRFLWLASVGFIIQWFGDSLDGTLARYRKIERPRYGFFVDHIIDSISEVLIFIGLGLSPFLRFDIALIALVSYLLATIYVYLTTYVNGVFRISYGGVGPTEMRLIAIGTNSVVFFIGNPSLAFQAVSLSLFDLIVIGVIIIILSLFLYNTIITASILSREDQDRNRAKAHQERIARRQALRDQRAARKTAAQSARQSRVRVQID
ncbi:MAG: CDP-alcohol phosphatidyltransferase family protein [Anaerolineaceae bacterium]|nr:CDP-alcohol phosphatidyltransferase family protein [Anaerolineaceae bacterium]